MSDQVDRFFGYAMDRESLRVTGVTEDPILKKYRFCNVYREDDRTTRWFAQHIRELHKDCPEVLFATVMFRWFNRIETALRLGTNSFCELNSDHIRRTLEGVSPIVTGAYIIKTPNGKSKLEGLIWCLEQIYPHCKAQAHLSVLNQLSLSEMHRWLVQFPYLGPFMAYEIVTDLRHTALLNTAPDIMTWANAGPGAIRGLHRIHGRGIDKGLRPAQSLKEMQELLAEAHRRGWVMWEMREVEHTLCEFDKYERARLGQGEPKQLYRPYKG